MRSKNDLLNSTFYSSTSINTMDHAKTFRNSLILNVLSDNSIANSTDKDEGNYSTIADDGGDVTYVEDNESDIAVKRDEDSNSSTLSNNESQPNRSNLLKKNEIQTINMTTSPSLSALANILQEKSKNADKKMRNSGLLNISEDNEVVENNYTNITNSKTVGNSLQQKPQIDLINSPNLIDIDGSQTVNYTQINSNDYDQPDFLTTPKIQPDLGNKPTYASNLDCIQESPVQETSNLKQFEHVEIQSMPKQSRSASLPKLEPVSAEQSTITNLKIVEAQPQIHVQPISESEVKQESQNDGGHLLEKHRDNHNGDDSNTNFANNGNKYPLTENRNFSTTSLPYTTIHSAGQPIKRSVTNEQIKNNLLRKGPRVDPKTRATRTVSTGPVLEQISDYKEKKGFFSFLKRKNKSSSASGDKRKNNNKTVHQQENKRAFSNSNNSVVSSPNDVNSGRKKEPIKSQSSNTLFSNFRKKKSERNQISNDFDNNELNISKTRIVHAETESQSLLKDGSHFTGTESEVNIRKPTPLNIDLQIKNDPELIESTTRQNDEKNDNISEYRESPAFSLPRPDAGEALFPKFLNSFEVDSIVSLERTRSMKSNKRSSITSHRRSLTDTLSINAQNEGMFIKEVGPMVISTPDLTKSPASSILRNGMFEPPTISSTIESSPQPAGVVELDHSHDDYGRTQYEYEEEQYDTNAFNVENMEAQFNQLISTDDTITNREPIPNLTKKEDLIYEEDEQLITDIMDFANIIDFGDELDVGLGINYNSQEPLPNNNKLVESMYDQGTEKETTQQIETRAAEQKSSLTEENEDVFKYKIPQDRIETSLPSPPASTPGNYQVLDNKVIDPNEFENEDFNEIDDSQLEYEQNLHQIDENWATKLRKYEGLGLQEPALNLPQIPETGSHGIPQLKVCFSSEILLFETYGEEEYDRRPDIATCNQLTPQLAQMIKAELNEIKDEMEIHEESKCYTHYY